MNPPHSTKYGFHLIELLIVIAIIGITTAFTLPLYTEHITQARRLEAASTLTKLALALEEYHVEHDTYADATLTLLHIPEIVAHNNYQLVLETTSATNYLIAAKPINKQVERDMQCATLQLNANGARTITGTGAVNDCW